MFKKLMQSYYNLKTIQKILLLVSVLSIFMITVGCTGIYFNKKAEVAMNEMYNDRLLPIRPLLMVRVNYNAIKFDLLKIINLDNKKERQILLDDMDKRSKENKQLMETYSNNSLTDYEKENLTKLDKYISDFKTIQQEILKLSNNNKKQEAYQLIYDSKEQIGNIFNTLGDLADFNIKRAKELNQINKKESKMAFYIMIGTIIVALIISLLFANFIASYIQLRLNQIVNKMQQVAEGNLTVEQFGFISTSDIGNICAAFDTMLKNMHHLISGVSNSIEQINCSSQELQSISETSSQATTQTTETIEQMATGSSSQAKDVSDSAQRIAEIANLSNEAVKNIENGELDVEKTINQITDIKDTTENLSSQINKLGGLAQEIEKIVELITNIASQTNLLALNAAIESARAGEHGKGFAVVAEEVKTLAEESGQAANQIKDMIEQIQVESEGAVKSTQTTVTMVEEGVNSIQKVKTIFETIKDSSKESERKTFQVSQAMENISSITEESAASAEEIAASMEEQNAGMEELSANAQMLSKLTTDLHKEIEIFKI